MFTLRVCRPPPAQVPQSQLWILLHSSRGINDERLMTVIRAIVERDFACLNSNVEIFFSRLECCQLGISAGIVDSLKAELEQVGVLRRFSGKIGGNFPKLG